MAWRWAKLNCRWLDVSRTDGTRRVRAFRKGEVRRRYWREYPTVLQRCMSEQANEVFMPDYAAGAKYVEPPVWVVVLRVRLLSISKENGALLGESWPGYGGHSVRHFLVIQVIIPLPHHLGGKGDVCYMPTHPTGSGVIECGELIIKPSSTTNIESAYAYILFLRCK